MSNDTGRDGDPYENFLTEGRRFSKEKGWPGLETEPDENAAAMLCYTSGTTGRVSGTSLEVSGCHDRLTRTLSLKAS